MDQGILVQRSGAEQNNNTATEESTASLKSTRPEPRGPYTEQAVNKEPQKIGR